MARKLPVSADGGASRRSGPSGRRHAGRRGRRAPHAPQRHTPEPRQPAGPAFEPVGGHGAWPRAVTAVGSPPPLAILDASAATAQEPLTLTGSEWGAMSETLAAWGRQRDQALNRLWRRPGGLARLAGV